jgi:hypothetical protein
MAARIGVADVPIPPAANDPVLAHHDGADWNFSGFKGALRAPQSLFHPEFVGSLIVHCWRIARNSLALSHLLIPIRILPGSRRKVAIGKPVHGKAPNSALNHVQDCAHDLGHDRSNHGWNHDPRHRIGDGYRGQYEEQPNSRGQIVEVSLHNHALSKEYGLVLEKVPRRVK